MFLKGQQSQEVDEFTGPQQAIRTDNLGPNQAVSAFNCEYTVPGVAARRGYEKILGNASNLIFSFFNWLGAAFNRVIYTTSTTIRIKNVDTGVDTLVYTTGAGTIVHAAYEVVGNSAYVALLQSQVVGSVFQLKGLETVIVSQDPTNAAVVTADAIWQVPPNSALFTALGTTLFGAGSTTAGIRNVAVVITTRSGQVCPPIAIGSITFEQGKLYTISITVGAGIPVQYFKMQLALTEAGAGSKGRYYIIPDVLNSFIITGGGTKTLLFGMSDTQLISEGTDTTPFQSNFYQGQLIQGAAVTLRPLIVKAYETRLAFVVEVPSSNVPGSQVESAIMFSDAGLPQSIGLSRSIVQLPGAKPITAVASLRNTFYVFGATYTYIVYSSVGDPATWATAQLIDGQVGAGSPFCVYENVSKGVIWVANQQGLWALIGGQYQQKPVSWYCDDWRYINWTFQEFLQVVDNSDDQTVYFSAALNNHPVYGTQSVIFTFNYEKGINLDSVSYSMHSYKATMGDPVSAGLADVRLGTVLDSSRRTRFVKATYVYFLYQFLFSTTDRFTEILYPGDPGFPGTTPVLSSYVHAPLPTNGSSPLRLNGMQCRVATLNGTLTPSVLARDGTRAVSLTPIVSTKPDVTDEVTTRLFNKQSNGVQIRFDGVGGWFLDWLKVFWTPFVWKK